MLGLISASTIAFLGLWVLLLSLCIRGPLLVDAERRDSIIFLGLAAVAVALHSAMPWGPIDFGEADRLQAAWEHIDLGDEPMVVPFRSVIVLMSTARSLGLSTGELFRWVGPMAAALAVPAVFACARAGGLSVMSSVLAALVLLMWPAHLRYGAAALASVGPTVWVLVFTAALARSLPVAWKVAMVGAGMCLGLYCRPELMLLSVAVIPLVFTDGWSWRHRFALAAIVAVGALPRLHAVLQSNVQRLGYPWPEFLSLLLRDWRMNPSWWIVAVALGLVAGKMRWQLRAALLLVFALLGFSYSRYAAEENPLWGLWRNLVVLTPFAALAAASLVDRLPRFRGRGAVIGAVCALSVAGGVYEWRADTRPLDGQAEFAWLRETAARVAAAHPDLVLLTVADLVDEELRAVPGLAGITIDANMRLAIASVLEGTNLMHCHSGGTFEAPRLWTADVLAPACSRVDVGRAALYLGLFRPPGLIARIERRFRLEPIEERVLSVAPAMQFVDTQCKVPIGDVRGSRLEDCDVRLGWYRLVPR